MKIHTALIAGLSALFLLTACEDESKKNEQQQTSPRTDTTLIAPAPAPSTRDAPSGRASRLSDERFLQASFDLTTRDGRNLRVTATAYCEKLNNVENLNAYRAQCAEIVRQSLNYFAADRECFEGSIPAVSAAVRNHAGLPQRADDRCHDAYPDNYAPWPEDMMRRTLEMTPDDNLYTVTGIEPR